MAAADEFIKYCTQILEANFGKLTNEIIIKIKAKKKLDDNSTASDLKEFCDVLETNLGVFAGKHKANEICNALRAKATEMTGAQKVVDNAIIGDIDKEVTAFLKNNALPSENDITDYAKYLSMKFGGNTKSVEKDLMEKVKTHVKTAIGTRMLKAEIYKFLLKFPQPEKSDIDDFLHYTNMLKLPFKENEVRDTIEKERLYRKFHEPTDMGEASELDQFINLVQANADKEAIGNLMQKQGLSYLIKDDSGVSDKSLSELIKLMTPTEGDMKDALEGMGLKHMINKK